MGAQAEVAGRVQERSPRLEVDEVQGRLGFAALQRDWDALATGGPYDTPFVRHGWARAWLESFAPSAPLRVFCARRGGEALAFAPFIERGSSLAGVPVRTWQSPANAHSQRFDWVLGREPHEAVGAIWRAVRDRGDWEVLLLRDVVRGGVVDTTLGAAAEADGFLVCRQPSLASPWLPVGPEEALGLEAHFRANLRRRRRRLGEVGPLRLQRAGHGPEVERVLERGLWLEGSGWKGEQGTAIRCHPATRHFYTALAREAAAGGWLALYLLWAGERPVAFHYGLQVGDTYFLLKPGYDEALGPCSPGQLLVGEVLADLRARGARTFDFLGPTMPWKRAWTARVREHCWMLVVRPSLKGRFLHALAWRLKPAAGRWLKEVRQWLR